MTPVGLTEESAANMKIRDSFKIFASRILEKSYKRFLVVRLWPKKASDVRWSSDSNVGLPKLAIVMQGPIDISDDFTLETIRLYKKNFPGALIIVSVLKGSDENCLKKIREEMVEVVISERPEIPGPFNANMQISSACAGIKRAKEMGAEYAIKTRNDQRIYGTNIFNFLLNLLNTFPLKRGGRQKERIISTNVFSFKYIPYVISDMTVFGHIDDMLLYWGADLIKNNAATEFTFEDPAVGVGPVKVSMAGEIYMVTQFLNKIGEKTHWSLDYYWQILADRFCVIDYQSLDLYWHKVERHHYVENKFSGYDKGNTFQALSFREWLNLYRKLC